MVLKICFHREATTITTKGVFGCSSYAILFCFRRFSFIKRMCTVF